MCFLKLAMPLPTGGVHIMELDEPAAREALAEMETWGDDCSQDFKEMRDALRAKFIGRTGSSPTLTPNNAQMEAPNA